MAPPVFKSPSCTPQQISQGSVASNIADYSAANVTMDYVDEGGSGHSVDSAFRFRGRGKFSPRPPRSCRSG